MIERNFIRDVSPEMKKVLADMQKLTAIMQAANDNVKSVAHNFHDAEFHANNSLRKFKGLRERMFRFSLAMRSTVERMLASFAPGEAALLRSLMGLSTVAGAAGGPLAVAAVFVWVGRKLWEYMDKLAQAALGRYQAAMGVTTIGGLQALHTVLDPEFGPEGVNAIIENVIKGRSELQSAQYAALTRARTSGMGMDVANQVMATLMAIAEQVQPIPSREAVSALYPQYQTILPQAQLLQLRTYWTPEKRKSLQEMFEQHRRDMEVTEQAGEAFAKLAAKNDALGKTIETVLENKLKPLAEPLGRLSDGFTIFAQKLFDSAVFGTLIGWLRNLINWIAKQVETGAIFKSAWYAMTGAVPDVGILPPGTEIPEQLAPPPELGAAQPQPLRLPAHPHTFTPPPSWGPDTPESFERERKEQEKQEFEEWKKRWGTPAPSQEPKTPEREREEREKKQREKLYIPAAYVTAEPVAAAEAAPTTGGLYQLIAKVQGYLHRPPRFLTPKVRVAEMQRRGGGATPLTRGGVTTPPSGGGGVTPPSGGGGRTPSGGVGDAKVPTAFGDRDWAKVTAAGRPTAAAAGIKPEFPVASGVNWQQLDAEYVARVNRLYRQMPESEKRQFKMTSGYRPATRAEARAIGMSESSSQEDIWERSGHGTKFAAAPPGRSQHQLGQAGDFSVTNYLRTHGAEVGLQGLTKGGRVYDYPHIQMPRGDTGPSILQEEVQKQKPVVTFAPPKPSSKPKPQRQPPQKVAKLINHSDMDAVLVRQQAGALYG
jgi:hypothetical protein